MADTFNTVLKDVVDKSGLSKWELAQLYVVSSQTIYNWYRNKGKPNQDFLIHHSRIMNDLLLRMVDAGILPFSRKVTRKTRRRNLSKVLQQAMKTGHDRRI